MNIERNTDEFVIKKLCDSSYMKFEKTNPHYVENANQITNLFRSIESSVINQTQDDDSSNDTKYVFIRLYDPVYKGLNAANLLKRGIAITEVNKIDASHATININLKDKFYGLTGMKDKDEQDFAIEQVTNVKTNSYMESCDPSKSTCRVYCIKCNEQEYAKTKAMIMKLYRSNSISYDVPENFIMALRSIKRKFFTPKNKRIIGRESIEIMSYESAKKDSTKIPHKFVCSTLVAYILYSNIQKVQNWFNKHNVEYEKITPSDLSAIRGMKYCFNCKWIDYNTTVKKFVENHEEFKEYL
jgi:hypothetical protein